MSKRVLITGGAGFIGSHLADELLEHGYEVRVLDNLTPQVHGDGGRPEYLSKEVELVEGDVRDADAVGRALEDVEGLVHLAASVGVGQSMYQIEHYTSVNNLGTAVLLESLARRPIRRLVVASSMSIYGEGAYLDEDGEAREVPRRCRSQLEAGDWEPRDGRNRPLRPVPTPESKSPDSTSVYALSKYDQERLCLLVGEAYGVPATALRLFNVYGPRQALSNPYTGVMAIFASRYLNGLPPLVFEDGRQQREFVHVRDVARAFRLALESEEASGQVFNIGSGRPTSICDIAESMAAVLGREEVRPEITEQYRHGDIRHCFADITQARRRLGYAPQVTFEQGLTELAEWLEGQVVVNRSEDAAEELRRKGLLV